MVALMHLRVPQWMMLGGKPDELAKLAFLGLLRRVNERTASNRTNQKSRRGSLRNFSRSDTVSLLYSV